MKSCVWCGRALGYAGCSGHAECSHSKCRKPLRIERPGEHDCWCSNCGQSTYPIIFVAKGAGFKPYPHPWCAFCFTALDGEVQQRFFQEFPWVQQNQRQAMVVCPVHIPGSNVGVQ